MPRRSVGNKISRTKTAKSAFNSWVETGKPEIKYDSNQFGHKKGDVFNPSPEDRKTFRRYEKNKIYFGSWKLGVVLSYVDPEKPIVLKPQETNQSKECRFKYELRGGRGERTRQKAYKLIGEIFDDMVEKPEKDEYLRKGEKPEFHHIEKYVYGCTEEALAADCNPHNLIKCSKKLHNILTNLFQKSKNKDLSVDEMKMLSDIFGGRIEGNSIATISEDGKELYFSSEKNEDTRKFINYIVVNIKLAGYKSYFNKLFGENDLIVYYPFNGEYNYLVKYLCATQQIGLVLKPTEEEVKTAREFYQNICR